MWRYRARILLTDRTTIIGTLLLLVLLYLMAVPVALLLVDSVTVQTGDARAAGEPGSLTSYYLWRTFRSPVAASLFWTPLWHTMTVSAVAVTGALVLGTTLAVLVRRTDVFGSRWLTSALIVPYLLPSWTFALAWLTIFKNRRTAGSPGWLEAVGITTPDWLAYGQFPIMAIYVLHYTPFVFMLVGNSLARLDSQYEEAARVAGAGWWRRMRTIVLPLLTPSLVSGAVLVFAKAIGEFGAAYVVGLPVGYQVLSTSLYQSVSTRESGVAAVLAGVLIVLGALSLLVDARFVKEARRFVTITGKGNRATRVRLGRWRASAGVFPFAIVLVSVIVPLLVLLLSTLMRTPGIFTAGNFSLDYWLGTDLPTQSFSEGVLVHDRTWSAVRNTVMVVGIAALLAGTLGMLTGYVVVRARSRVISRLLRMLAFIPYLVPGIAFALSYLTLFAVQRGPIPALYGTTAILLLVLMADEMPFASRAGVTSMSQLGKEPEEAAAVAGAGWGTRMRTIVLPIQRSALAAAIVLPFISGVQSLSPVIILATPGTHTLTTLSMNLVDNGYMQAANAVTLIICLVALLGMVITRKILRADISSGLGA